MCLCVYVVYIFNAKSHPCPLFFIFTLSCKFTSLFFMEMNEDELPLPQQERMTTFQDYLPKPAAIKEREEIHPALQFVIFFALIAGAMVISLVISGVVLFLMGGLSVFDMEKAMLDPKNLNAIKVVQVLSTVIMFFAPAYFFALIISKKPLKYLGFNTKVSFTQLALVLIIAVAGLFLSGALGELNKMIPISASMEKYFKGIEDRYMEQMMALLKMTSFKEYIISLFIVALIPAIVEEVFFRAGLQQLLTKWFRQKSVIILLIVFTSIIFSAVHFSYYGFLPRAALGVILGLLYYYSKNIWTSIFAHFLNNGIAVTQFYVMSTKGKIDKKVLEETFPIWWGVIALAVIIVLMLLYKKVSDFVLEQKTIEQTQNNLL